MGSAGPVETPGAGGRKLLLKRLEGPSTMVLGLVAALLIIVVVRRPFGDISGIRVKDHARVGFFLTHGGTTAAGRLGDVVRPGDTVQFVYTARAPSFLVILAAGAGGHVHVLTRRRASGARARRPRCRAAAAHGARRHHRPRARRGALLRAADRHRAVRRAWQASWVSEPPIPGCYADITGWRSARPEARADPPPVTFDRAAGGAPRLLFLDARKRLETLPRYPATPGVLEHRRAEQRRDSMPGHGDSSAAGR